MSGTRYEQYKESGVEWLGRVPSHWRVDRLKASVDACRNGIWGEEAQDDGNDIPCVRVADFDRRKLRVELVEPTIRNVTEKERIGRVLRRGDLLLEKSGGGENQPVGCVVLYDDPRPAVCSNFVARMVSAPGQDSSYWRYVHAAAYAIRLTVGSINQTSGIQNLDQARYFNEYAVFPPQPEQAAIAAFLDLETDKIDALVEEQRRLIELLKEKRQAVISQAVTKGLNQNAPMKDSGVEWLGKMPAHWGIVALKRLGSIRYGIGEPPKYQAEGVPLIRATNVHAGKLFEDGLVFVDPNDIPSQRIVWLAAGDIIVVRSGAYTGDSAIIPEAYGRCIAGFDMVVRCSNVIPQFLQLALLSSYLKFFQIDLLKLRAAQPHLNAEELGACLVVLPPAAEQTDIVRFLEDQLSRIDALNAEAEAAVGLLRERRSALISAAVTGKIDVRGLVPQPEAFAA